VAASIAVTVGGLAAVTIAARPGRATRAMDTLLMLPLGTSAVTIGFGFLVALDRWPVDLRAKTVLVPLAQAVVAIPFVIRAVVPALRSIDPRLREVASVLGASPRRVWREVDLPIVLQAFAVGFGFAMAVSLGEFGATSFVARPDAPTIPIAIARFLSRPGALNIGQAMAMSTVLMVVTGAVLLAIEYVQARELGEL
jgi:thiamine transport system permease protein